MFEYKDERFYMFVSVAILLVIGLTFIFSAGSLQAVRIGKPESFFFYKQILAMVLGLCFMYISYSTPLYVYRKFVVLIYFLTVVLLLLVFAFPAINGANRWISLPFLSIQPSELAKFTVVLYLAHYLDKKDQKIKVFVKGFFPASLMLGFLASLVLIEPDFGTAFLLIAVSATLLFIGGMNMKHLVAGIAFILPLIGSLVMMGYRKERILSFIDPWKYSDTTGYQLIQSLIAVGSGGIFGKGLGNSSQKLYFLPEAHTDFIYAIISEEFGIIGAATVIILILVLFVCGLRIAASHVDRYKRYLTMGLCFVLFYQAIIHFCAVLGLTPTKGIPLPFVSYGGSAMVFQLFLLGIIFRSAEER